jgi:hypothetical protein
MLKNANKNSQNSHTQKCYHNGFNNLKIIKLNKIFFFGHFYKNNTTKTRKNSQKLAKVK